MIQDPDYWLNCTGIKALIQNNISHKSTGKHKASPKAGFSCFRSLLRLVLFFYFLHRPEGEVHPVFVQTRFFSVLHSGTFAQRSLRLHSLSLCWISQVLRAAPMSPHTLLISGHVPLEPPEREQLGSPLAPGLRTPHVCTHPWDREEATSANA